MDGSVLHVWNRGWNLPSADSHCLAILAYCKFTQAPVRVVFSNSPWKSPNGELPYLVDSGVSRATSVEEIFNYFRQKGYNTDHSLSSKQCADIIAYANLLGEKLYPALQHLMWVDSKTYVEVTRPRLSKLLPLWYRPYYLYSRHRTAEDRTQLVGTFLSETERENYIVKNAKECFNILSARLGDNEFFFGKTPTSFDALVFGYLAVVLRAPLSNTALQSHLRGCPNLTTFCSRILDRYFPLSEAEAASARFQEEEERRQKAQALEEFPNSTRNTVVGVVVAVVAMAAYAVLSGLVTLEISREHNDNDNSTQEGGDES